MTVTHRMSQSREWQCWAHMRARCGNRNHAAFKNYGGRGIKVCARWINSFENFFADMGKKPSPDLDLDRIDNDGDYAPGNCRWVARITNLRNKRNNRMLIAFGQNRCLSEWAKLYGMSAALLNYRLRAGWPIEQALTKPPMNRPRNSPDRQHHQAQRLNA